MGVLSLQIAAVFIFRAIGQSMATYFLGLTGNLVTRNLRKDMFNHLIGLPLEYYDKHPSGQILSKLTYNVDQITKGISNTLVMLIRDSFAIVGLLVWIFYLNWYLALLFILIGIPIVSFIRYAIKRFQKISKKVQEVYGHVTSDIQRAVDNNASIKVSNAQGYVKKDFSKNNEDIFQQKRKEFMVQACNSPVIGVVLSLSVILVINIGISNTFFPPVSISVIASITTALFLMYRHIKQLTNCNSVIQACLMASSSIFQFLAEPQEKKGHQKTYSENSW